MVSIRKAVACLALAVCLGCTDGGRQGLNPGDTAPNVSGEDLAGAPKSLHDVKGKAVLVNFWASWCAPCVTELPALQALYDQLKDKGFQVVGIAVDDTPENIKEYQKKFNLTFPIIIDSKSESKRGYEIKGLPESFILDGQHRVVMIQDIGDGSPITRIVGPREWSSPKALEVLGALVK